MNKVFSPFLDDSFKVPEEVPFFPLPEMALLPGEPMPLHIFEERYKVMTETALVSDRMIVMGHVKQGWEKRPGADRETYGIAGIGQIVMDERLQDGRFNLVLLGLKRIKITQVLPSKPFRKARIEILDDQYSQTSSSLLESLEKEILRLANALTRTKYYDAPASLEGYPALNNIAEGSLPLGALCDFTAAALNLPSSDKQMILDELDVVQRSEKLLFLLRFHLKSVETLSAPLKLLH